MKIENNKKKTKQLFKLHVIKSRVYNKNTTHNLYDLPNINISKIILKLKKSIQIIFKFHKQNKKILFIGIPKIVETKINIETNHVAIPKFINIFGLFLNKSVFKNFKSNYQVLNNKDPITFSKLLYKPDLIVIFDSDNSYYIMQEGYRSKIPIINFNSDFCFKKRDKFYSYDIPGNFKFNKKSIDNIFFKVINSILKK